MLTVMAIVFMVVVLPVWLLLHYLTRMKGMRGLKQEDEAALEKLWEDAVRMEKRIASLETILDIKHPEWRDEQ
ncbi:MAG: envelope stress response membrane protein PspB [Desulfocapsa sp.]|nr:MAG: envelope stress response membrane protein PspB [Desulfocapsa sp.]